MGHWDRNDMCKTIESYAKSKGLSTRCLIAVDDDGSKTYVLIDGTKDEVLADGQSAEQIGIRIDLIAAFGRL